MKFVSIYTMIKTPVSVNLHIEVISKILFKANAVLDKNILFADLH